MLKAKQLFLLWGIYIVFGVVFGPKAYALLPSGITVSIEPAKATYNNSDSLAVTIRYTNVSDSTVRFLTRSTALENEINEDFLTIIHDGQPLPYSGRHVKRLPPSDSEYISIEPGQSVSGTVDLEFAYPIFEKGLYAVAYKGSELSTGDILSKSSPAVTLELAQERPIKLLKRTPNIDSSCSATQRAQIDQALGIAENIAISARNALNDAPAELRPTAQRYTEWFGQFSTGRYATVQTAFNRIASALSNQVIGFDCTCDISGRDNVFAFVRSNDPFNMNVCPVFFRVAPSGTDSRSGTIVHEISHFNVVIGSDDFQSALNQSGSRRLARSNPSSAIRNANAFEYFAENSPFLSMPTIDDLPSPPDLLISEIGTSDQNPIVEDIINVNAFVSNIGERESAVSQVTLRLSEDALISVADTQLAESSVPALAMDASYNFQTDFQAPNEARQYWIGVCVASVDREIIIDNNCSTAVPLLVDERPITIAPMFLLLLDEDDN